MAPPPAPPLFTPHRHAHVPQNANTAHHAEQARASFNQQLAVALTRIVGTMACAYVFALLALFGFPALASVLNPQIATYVQWTSQTFIQLTMLSVIMVGQAILGRKAEIQAEEQYQFVLKTYHDTEQLLLHLDAQDRELLKQTALLERAIQQLAEQSTGKSSPPSRVRPTSKEPTHGEPTSIPDHHRTTAAADRASRHDDTRAPGAGPVTG